MVVGSTNRHRRIRIPSRTATGQRGGRQTSFDRGNFYDCVVSRKPPLADVISQHRSVSVCHLANISMRLGRSLAWNPDREQFVDDAEANRWLSRDRRHGFELG